MNKETFFEQFEILSDIPNGVEKLRELILQLAVQGRLLSQNSNDEAALILLNKVKAEREQLIKENKLKNVKILPPVDPKGMPFSIPNNWVWVRLGELGITQTGTTPKKGDNLSYGEDFPFVKPADILPNLMEYGNEGLSQEGVSKYGRLASAGSILMVCIGSIGKANVIERDCSFNQQINSLTPHNCLNSYLINYFLRSDYFQSEAWARSSRTTLAILNKGKWEKIPVPLPPLEEQKRIVAKVDQLMALCDQLEARQQKKYEQHILLNNAALDKLLTAPTPREFAQHWQRICDNFNLLYDAPETVGQLWQAILQMAVQGKLVVQDPGDEPAAVLVEKIRIEKERLIKENKIKSIKPLPKIQLKELNLKVPDSYEIILLGECIGLISGQHLGKNEQNDQGEGLAYLTGPADFGKINPIAKRWTSHQKAISEKDDILITVKGAGVGKTNILGLEKAAIGRQLMAIRPIVVYQKYVYLLILGSYEIFQSLSDGSTVPGIERKDILHFPFGLPPLEEQKRIVAKVDQLMPLCDELEAGLTQAQTDGGKLMEAVVHHVLAE